MAQPTTELAIARSGANWSWRRWWGALGRYVLCFGVIANLPFWLAAPRQGIANPGLLNLDALGLGVLALYLRPGWIIGLYAFDFLLDIVYGIRATYGTNYVEIFLSLRYVFTVVSQEQLLIITSFSLLLIAGVGLAWIYWRPNLRGRERTTLAAVVLALLIPLALWSRVQRQEATAAREAAWARGIITSESLAPTWGNIAASPSRSPAISLLHAWSREHMADWLRGRYSQIVGIHGAMAQAEPYLPPADGERPNLVLALVESWGAANNGALAASLTQPFQSATVARRYRTSAGFVNFQGATAAGELRELCGVQLALSTAPLAVSPQALAGCLPWQLDHAGYQTWALDSAIRFWPGAGKWYQLFGFQHTLGFDDFRRLGMPEFDAGPFRSIRDPEVAHWLPSLLIRQGRPRMIFWMTMSAHLPVHQPLPAEYDADCGIAAVTQHYASACGWYKVERLTLQSIAAAAAAPGLPATVFIVVGDHAPPFVDGARTSFSSRKVPYVLLVPRRRPPLDGRNLPRGR